MNKTMTKLCFLSLMTIGFAACTEDPANNNSTSTPDMSTTPVEDMSTTTDQGPGTTDEGPDTTDQGPDTTDAGPDQDTLPEADSCASANPPARCTADPATFDEWAPASVISKLELQDESCCFDYDGDANGEPNNRLGSTLEQLGSLGFTREDANQTIADAIADGSIALVLEHENVDLAGGPFSINFLLGQQDGDFTAPLEEGGNAYKIDPVSFEQGVWPQARINDASLTGTKVEGGPGVVAIVLSLFDVQLTLRIVSAQLDTVVDADNTSVETGVKLSQGRLGGVIRIDDIIGALNDFADTNCGCLQLQDEKFINGDIIDGYDCGDTSGTTCDAEAEGTEGICAQVAGFCDLATGVLPGLADVNSSAIGQPCSANVDCDATSVGFTFEAYGAKITGVGTAE